MNGINPNRKTIRCAIYTRKSTTIGLDQDFNSLDAQRDACEAYIASQRQAGWILIPTQYNDGGFTGGNTERPALQQLLEDVHNGEIDCVVVHRVDRLSRSLIDFAKLIDLFEKRQIGFVSVSQQFDSTNSMGRLTLNILLSFAQFEREIISERTREKLAAARRKGKWVGGHPMLGYDLAANPRRLIINEDGAEAVRKIFETYLQVESIQTTAMVLNRDGHRTKQRKTRDGAVVGGRPFNAGCVQAILRNPVYLGKVQCDGQLYEGEHEAIIGQETFGRAAAILDRNRREGDSRQRTKTSSFILKGLLRCSVCGCALTTSYANKGGRRYRYYRCYNYHKNHNASCPNRSISGPRIEREFIRILTESAAGMAESNRPLERKLSAMLADVIRVWDVLYPAAKTQFLRQIIKKAGFNRESGMLKIEFNREGVCSLMGIAQATDDSSDPLTFTGKVNLNRRKNSKEKPAAPKRKTPSLREYLILSYYIQTQLDSGNSYEEIGAAFGRTRTRIRQIHMLRFLAPSIQEEILNTSPHIPERDIRAIPGDPLWSRQIENWNRLKSQREKAA